MSILAVYSSSCLLFALFIPYILFILYLYLIRFITLIWMWKIINYTISGMNFIPIKYAMHTLSIVCITYYR